MARTVPCRFAFAIAAAISAAVAPNAYAQLEEDTARQAAQGLRVLVTEGTGVIGDLQPTINAGKATKEEVAPDALVGKFTTRYEKATGKPFDPKAPGVVGDARRAYLQSYTTIVTRFQGKLTKGGKDAFVPAVVRAQVLKVFNQQIPGTIQAYATNRDNDLINTEWAVKRVMKGSPLAGDVQGLMATGSLEPVVRRTVNTVMGYYPMKLAPECVACHAQNGLKQTEGAFGGALVAEIPVK